MANYFYADATGTKQGPYNEQQLQALAAQGIITPATPLETDSGHKGVAGQIPGLFATTSVPPFVQATSQPSGRIHPQGASILMWPLDFAFRDIRIHVFNLWVCRICYVICWIAAMGYLLFGTFAILTMVNQNGGLLGLLLIPLLWIGIAFGLILSRLYLEFFIVLLDWMVATTKAARKYLDE